MFSLNLAAAKIHGKNIQETRREHAAVEVLSFARKLYERLLRGPNVRGLREKIRFRNTALIYYDHARN